MKTVLITGGTRGIGRSLTELFLENGYRTLFLYKNSEEEARVLESMGAKGYQVDLSNPMEIEHFLSVLQKEEQVDILINNAGISLFGLFTELSNEEISTLYQVDLMAPITITRQLLPKMISGKFGRIINISSMWGQVGASCEVDYSTAKAGILGFTKALAKEVGPSNITVNAVCPGVIDTEMNRGFSKETMDHLKEEIPLGRFGQPLDVAKFCLYLTKDDASFVTGQVFGINGGMVIV